MKTFDRQDARNRGAALTAATGDVMEMLHAKIRAADSRPTEAELLEIARASYGQRLAQFCDEQRQNPAEAEALSLANRTFADLYQRMIEHGGHVPLMVDEEAVLLRKWGPARVDALKQLVAAVDAGYRPIKNNFIDGYLRDQGFQPHEGLRRMVMPLLFEAYRDACIDAEADRQGLVPNSRFAVTMAPAPAAADHPEIPADWRPLSPTEVAERLIAHTPAMFEHRSEGKRAAAQVDEHTIRQIRWAATLLDKSMGGRPLWTASYEDLKELDRWFDRLPTTCGKSPWHRDADTTLEAICMDAVQKVDEGSYEADQIGLSVGTTNKHYRKLAQIHAFLRDQIGGAIPALNFSEFVAADLKDEREARAAYTVEQGRELFSLPPWTGCRSATDRLSSGDAIFHDALFFVLLLVWYTGMRREEVCKLLTGDIQQFAGIDYIFVRPTTAGRVKTGSSKRFIAVCDELKRLGFIEYVEAIRAAGHDALFPELVSERAKAKKGDTFYKIWWIYVAPLMTSLQRGQALHSARHMVDTELKELQVFSEFRDDALGHKAKGEGPSRYAKATRLQRLLEVVNQIPVVTDHLADCTGTFLLPKDMRKPRPSRI